LRIQETMVSLVLPPPYSIFSPLLNQKRVGNPWIEYFSAIFLFSVASTLARATAGSTP
jgi:hypothetical protein